MGSRSRFSDGQFTWEGGRAGKRAAIREVAGQSEGRLFDSELGLFEQSASGLSPNQGFFNNVPIDEGQVILLPFQMPQAVNAEELLTKEQLSDDEFKLWLYEANSSLLRISKTISETRSKGREGEAIAALWDAVKSCKRSVSINGKLLYFTTREGFREAASELGIKMESDANVRMMLTRATRFFLSRQIMVPLVEQKGRFPRILTVEWPINVALIDELKSTSRKPVSTAIAVSGKSEGARVMTNQMRAISAGLPSSNIDIKTGKPERRFVGQVMLPVEGDFVLATHEIEASTELGHMIQKDMHAVSTVNAMIVHEIFKRSRTGVPPSKVFKFTLDELAIEMGRKKKGVSLSTKDQVEISEQLTRAGNSVLLF